MNAPGFMIELKDVKFFAFHGVYEEERKTGNEFLVNLTVELENASKRISTIRDTVNYVTLFEIVQEQMNQPQDLLETLAMNISERIHERFPSAANIKVRIDKKNPVIPHFSGSVSVTYKKTY